MASIVLPVQALGELFTVLVLKAKRPAANARAAILGWRDTYAPIDASSAVIFNAADLATDHHLRIGRPSSSPLRQKPDAGCCSARICKRASRGVV